ncbi:MAG: L,D-transpeptidase family protein [Woeseiaceae bacterium]|nr:L,D-transpeptidase family protein [Woeseiaceae bacterium]
MHGVLASIVAGLVAVLLQASAPSEADLKRAIRDQIGSSGAGELIARIYERREFAPVWQDAERVGQLLEAVRASYDDGLRPADYQLSGIEKLQRSVSSGQALPAARRAAFDVVLTDGLARLVDHLCNGKVDPDTREPARAAARPFNGRDPSLVIGEIIGSDNLVDAISSVAPENPDYDRLRAQLARYRTIAADGGWPELPGGPTIRPGSDDPRIEILARRLAISGDLADAESRVESGIYDPLLEVAVRRFQARHGLDDDGLVGRATLRALNVTAEQRIEQIRVNLDRARWGLDRRTDDLIVIDVAGFKMHVIRDQETTMTKRVIVGEVEERTPLFQSRLEHIVFNPAWSVPYSIASEEILPRIKEDPGYLARGRYQLIDGDGNVIDASAVDWSKIHSRNLPFTVVQQPGPANQLGLVKFLLPNEFSVCMHDTNDRSTFARAGRALSHGCIRVEEPLDLAAQLLGRDGWTRARIDNVIASGKTRTVALEQALPVVILYRTAEANDRGEMHFYGDIYERDPVVLEALDSQVSGITLGDTSFSKSW